VVRIVGHYAPWLLAVLMSALTVLTLVPDAVDIPWPVLVPLLGVAVALGLSILVHNRSLCERCIAALPLDATATAARYARRFKVAHLFEHRLFALGYLAGIVGTSLLYGDPVGRYAWAAAQLSLVYLLMVYVTHQRLRPWCPHCRNGGEERATPVTPSPVSSQL
jgi:hypothetical protein